MNRVGGKDGVRPAPYSTATPRGGKGRSVTGLPAQIATARAIANTPSHPKSREVSELLAARDKGWVEDSKFAQLLQGMLF